MGEGSFPQTAGSVDVPTLEVRVFDFRRQRLSPAVSSAVVVRPGVSQPAFSEPAFSKPAQRKHSPASAAGPMSSRSGESSGVPRELPDVTGFLVVVLVTLGLFVVPVGATIMQGPAIVASILGR